MASSVHMNSIDGAVTTYDNTATTIITFPITDPDVSMRIEGVVIARRPDNGNAKTWSKVLLIDKTADGTPTMLTSVDVFAPIGSIGAATWNLGVTFDPDHVFIQVVGQATQINWFASASAFGVMGD